MKFKKIIILFIALLFGLTSCGEHDKPIENSNNKPVAITKYNVKWIVEGEVVKEEQIKKNYIPEYKEIPVKEANEQYHYEFKGWNPTPVRIKQDTTFTAVFEEVLNKYTISFDTLGGEEMIPVTYDYGTKIDSLPNAHKDGVHFDKWTLDKENKNPVVFPYEIKENVTFFAMYNNELNNEDHLATLLSSYSYNPLKNVPLSLTRQNNFNYNDLNINYTNGVNISDLNDNGFLSEWNAVLVNLEANTLFNTALKTVDLISNVTKKEYKNYLATNPSDVNHFKKVGEVYTIYIENENNIFKYVVNYQDTNNIEIQIVLTLNLESKEKTGRVQLGNENSLKYILKDDNYECMINTKELTSYLHLYLDENKNYNGEIIEFKNNVNTSYQFKITENKTYVIGNSQLFIKEEVYDNNSGKLLLSEEDSLTGKYLYFNVSDIPFIQNIKVTTLLNNTYYINNEKFITKNNLIEKEYFGFDMVNKYFTVQSLDNNNIPLIESKPQKTPMFFVDESKFETIKEDVKIKNPNFDFNLTIKNEDVLDLKNKFVNDLTLFNEFKSSKTKDEIITSIGNKEIIA